MASDTYSKCACKNCGGHIEYPARGAGSIVKCPHCGLSTTLPKSPHAEAMEGKPDKYRSSRRKPWVSFVAGLIGTALAVGAFIFWIRLQQPSSSQPPATSTVKPAISTNVSPPVVTTPPAPPPDPWNGIKEGAITIERSGDSKLIYAVGILRNESDHQRYGVKVTLDLLNAKKETIGLATDYTQWIDVGKEWKFKALVTEPEAVSARVVAVTEN